MNISVSIIIVSFNTYSFTRQCLQSIYKHTRDISYEVIVSDNGSEDGSVEMIRNEFPQVILLENEENLGFGRANNKGVKIAKGEYIFYLNSDTVLLNNAVKLFYDYWQSNEDLGALGCILQDDKGLIIHSGGDFPTYKSLCRYYMRRMLKNYAKSILKWLHMVKFVNMLKQKHNFKSEKVDNGEIGYITGADLFIKNDDNAFFDEKFFLYYEETDLLLRLKNKTGKKCVLIDSPKIIHYTRKSNPNMIIESKGQIFNQVSAIRYAQKHLVKNPRFLKFIFRVNMLNPYINEQKKTIDSFLLEL